MNSAEVLKSTDSDIYSKNIKASDSDLFNIVKQVSDLTGCSHDAAATILFDCNYDIERAVDKIFEHPVQTTLDESNNTSNDWKEVAKTKKKVTVAEVAAAVEINTNTEIETFDNKQRSSRGTGRGRGRNVRSNGRTFDNNNDTNTRNNIRGRGRRPQMRLTTNRGRSKPYYNQEFPNSDQNHEADSDSENRPARVSNEWLTDDAEPDVMLGNDISVPIESLTINSKEEVPNPVDIVAKFSSKNGVFGDFSRTKAPPPSTIVPTEPIRLVTSNGVMILPSRTAFNFGLDFAEYCDSRVDNNDHVIPRLASDEEGAQRRVHCEDTATRRVIGDDIISRRVHDESSISRRVHVDDNVSRISQDIHTPTSPTKPIHHNPDSTVVDPSFKPVPQCLSDNSYTAATILPPSAQLCPPPGMSNAHILQQMHSPQQYLSLMNVQNGPSMFDLSEMVSSTSSNEQQMLHSVDSKDFLPKSHTPKTHNDHEHPPLLNAMQMSNICCFPQVYMNNFANFMPAVPGHSSAGQSVETNTKPLFAQRNYGQQNDEICEGGKYDDVVGGKHKYSRTQNYGNYGGKDEGHDGDKIKMNAAQAVRGQPINQGRPNQQQVSNDPRFLAFHHGHQAHAYSNNMYNCVTAPGPHPTAPHPYAMAHQTGGIPQLHPQLQLLQQQMHNFPPSYQFQEQHLMNPMVPNSNNRNNSGSNNNQSRNGRSNNTLWHPSN